MAEQYPNRSDLRGGKVPKMVATGQTYGEAGKQMAAQSAVPMAPSPTAVVQPAGPNPGQVVDLTGVSQRPNEPISAGMPFGAGPGPEVFGFNNQPALGSNADLAERVRAIASLYPNPALLQLLMDLQA
jgi:hypothetical protein